MALSKSEIQKRSDEKRGVKSRGYKLPIETIELISELSKLTGTPQSKIIENAISMYKSTIKRPSRG
ncbi:MULTISPECIES: ribbon-helix-helix domain-containing protein [unclassified Gilliamella]|uniref:ribbon-helix-helix domain-containing protein n=1 Tax=unclassified Gilliamella TaxID=2685620 RepID=UPI0029FF65B2|nr:ribbon-helix-helix domain-containing protein [Gilliamella sp. B3801]MCX8591939.1 ribbon-helix-helix domain-containing protein [Gilliamella sp. B3804]